jgi:uncharacterized protein (TIGR02145 family)
MKRLFLVTVAIFLTASAFAQAPQKMSYQAVIRDASNHLVTTQIGMQVSILQGTVDGTVVYSETQTPTPNTNGLVTIEIGDGNASAFAAIDWSAGPYYIKTETAIEAPLTIFTITGTSQLLSVPYALNAKTAENAYWIKNGNDLSYTAGKIGIGVNTPLYSLDVEGSNQFGTSWIKETTLPHTGVHEAILYIANNSNNASSQANISFAAGNPGHGRAIISSNHDISAGTYNGNLNFKVRNGTTSYLTALTIRSSGNVGINQPNPSTKLDVNGVITSTGANFTGTTTVPTPVNPTDAATKAYVDNLLMALGIIPGNYTGTISDIDGNYYTTFTIGTQTWIAQNLKTTKYKDGTAIPLVTDNTDWSNLITSGYCWYDNNEAIYKNTHGALYNWYTVNTGNLCPNGWHVSTDADWTTLENYLIANSYNYDGTTTGNKIAKSLASITGWTSSATTGAVGNTDYPAKRNATGFTALPGGYRYETGIFVGTGIGGYRWSATETNASNAWFRGLASSSLSDDRNNMSKKNGFSIRCLKD